MTRSAACSAHTAPNFKSISPEHLPEYFDVIAIPGTSPDLRRCLIEPDLTSSYLKVLKLVLHGAYTSRTPVIAGAPSSW
jgi:hypothetical protein